MHQLASLFAATSNPTLLLASIDGAAQPLMHSEMNDVFLFLGLLILFGILVLILMVVSGWLLYKKAGRPGWTILVPVYNTVTILEMVSKPLWWIVLTLIPFVNIPIWIILSRRLAAVFGKGRWFTVGLILLPFVFYPILAFGKSVYQNNYAPPEPLSERVKWTLIGLLVCVLSEILLAAYGATATNSPEPLKVLSHDYGYATDGVYVYDNDVPILGADPSTFHMVGVYGVDASHVYYDGEVLEGGDPATFALVGTSPDTIASYVSDTSYARDAVHVYYLGNELPGADARTFVILGNAYAKDANTVYYYEDKIIGADPATFEVVDSYADIGYDAKDAQHFYGGSKVYTPEQVQLRKKK